ncbi:MAG TPA: hypothetical protein VGS79_14550 [Puia sp.]|nr:hypothetical protein [Puia sp.]
MAETPNSLLPEITWDLAKIGVVLYVIGLTVNFLYLIQWHVLSVDLVKPAAILVGLYVWLLAAGIPRAILHLIYWLNPTAKSKKKSNYFLFGGILLVLYSSLLWWINAQWMAIPCALLITVAVFTCCLPAIRSIEALRALKQFRWGISMGVMAILFPYLIYPNLPQYLGGGHPLEVKVCPSEKSVMNSQFSKASYDDDGCIAAALLYESEKDYYFIEEVPLGEKGLIVEYRVHKVKKSLYEK